MSQDTNIKVTTVTPELAEAWLGKNTHNRNIRQRVVSDYARDMANGDWNWNGEAIKFAADGTLVDGQHRLHAIVKSEVPIKMLVVHGVSMESQHTMDTGAKRKVSDALKLRGEKNYTHLAAGIRGCILWDEGARSFGGGGGRGVTVSEAFRYLDDHPELKEYAAMHAPINAGCKIPTAVSIPAMKVLYGIDYEDAQHFFSRLASDEGHYKGEPIYALRKALMVENDKAKIGRTTTWKFAVLIKAWNKYRMGDACHVLTYRPGGAIPEKFPEPI